MNVTAVSDALYRLADKLEASELQPDRSEASVTASYRAALDANSEIDNVLAYTGIMDVLDDAVVTDRTIVDSHRAAVWRYDVSKTVRTCRVSALRAVRNAREALDGVNPGKVHVVADGDTLQRLSARYLGDWTLWERIASFNRLVAPFAITPGQSLRIPDTRR